MFDFAGDYTPLLLEQALALCLIEPQAAILKLETLVVLIALAHLHGLFRFLRI